MTLPRMVRLRRASLVWLPILSGVLLLTGIRPTSAFEGSLTFEDCEYEFRMGIGGATLEAEMDLVAQSMTTEKMEARILQDINQIRVRQGLQPLRSQPQLTGVARRYSQQMAERRFFSHSSPEGSTPRQRVESAGVQARLVGENLFMSTRISDPVPVSIRSWMNSSGHRRNILLPQASETGVGIWRQGQTYYVTQIFLEPDSLGALPQPQNRVCETSTSAKDLSC
ncbi:hypothetical protein GS597_03925 [Synechococcales cyanobacterium C]|uniref:SCP domain-containing protein n=1 Tax=Petrachloros mirabilis ULC683 TaxID=2781853 RepID=A0A8K2AC51_9CYAN|nr:CAP domain-containing protein [Petrachloros mirabilis]NCJ05670.1 hypothetical protein [Petrachloros mirabilis ULC683]